MFRNDQAAPAAIRLALGLLASMVLGSLAAVAAASVADLEFEILTLALPDAGIWRETRVADADGDGRNEVVVVTAAAHLYVFSIDSRGDLELLESVPLPSQRPGSGAWVSPQVEDVDGDGDRDLLAWWRSNNHRGILDVAYRGPDGLQVTSYPTAETDAGYRLELADFDGDGLKDALTVNHGFSAPAGLFILFNDPDPAVRFQLSTDLALVGEATGAYSADLNADGLLDVAVTIHDAGPAGLRLLLSSADDDALIQLDPGDGTRTSSVAFGDGGQDGLLDIVTNATVPHAGRSYLWLYEQQPGGAFAPPRQLFASGDRPKMPTFADLDGDGSEELLVSVTSSRSLDIFGRDAAGSLAGPPRNLTDFELASVDHGFGTNPNVLTVGDIDNDGDLDVLVGGDGTVLVRNRTNRPPVADAGEDAVLPAGPSCVAGVRLDASGSSDPDGDVLAFSWTDSGGVVLPGDSPELVLGPGSHTFELEVSDGRGGVDSDNTTVAIEDRSPPATEIAMASPGTLWPPNHAMLPVSVAVTATDNCTDAPACRIIDVQSNEPIDGTGDGSSRPDWRVTGDLTVELRAERSGTGRGRVYSIVLECSDASGNAAESVAEVWVRRSRR